jgi:hypothetical protein
MDAPPLETTKAVPVAIETTKTRIDLHVIHNDLGIDCALSLSKRPSACSGAASAGSTKQERPGCHGTSFEKMVINKRVNHCGCARRLGQQAVAGPAWTTATACGSR